MKYLMACIFALAASAVIAKAHAAEEFSNKDIAVEALVLTSMYLDYRQTLDIKNHAGYTELNPIMGEHPSDVRIRNHFMIGAVLHVGIARLLPGEYRAGWQYGVLAAEVLTIIHNRKIGLSFNF